MSTEEIVVFAMIFAFLIAAGVNLLVFRTRRGAFSLVLRMFGSIFTCAFAIFLILFLLLESPKVILLGIISIVSITTWYILKGLGYDRYRGELIVVEPPSRKEE